ncbi:MAG: hypothetical protein VKP62_06670 [Candidatus Sericytochromatia bacterium]|nr:hypothetical protein [Candidatus Sericytochromatia bacterium]
MTGPINKPGTAPLSPHVRLPDGSMAGAGTPPPGREEAGSRDASQARARPGTARLNPVNLEALAIPETPAPAPAASDRLSAWATEKASQVQASVTELATTAAQAARGAGELARAGVNAVEAGIEEVRASRRAGQDLWDSVRDGVGVGGTVFYRQAIDPLLDRSVLGADDQFPDAGVGALGPVLTRRLGMGESVDLKVEAGVTLPTELVGAPNIKLDRGGTLRLKRVSALDENNQPVLDPRTGQPATRLEVSLMADNRTAAAYSASVGISLGVKLGQETLGVHAEAEAEAEAGLTGRVEIKLQFDPERADQMVGLTAVMKQLAGRAALAQLPGADALTQQLSPEQTQQGLRRAAVQLESISGSGGLYLAASARARLAMGLDSVDKSRKTPPSAASEAPPSPSDEPVGGAARLAQQARSAVADQAVDAAKEVLNESLVNLAADLGGRVEQAVEQNLRTGTRTVSISVEGRLKGSAQVAPLAGGAGFQGNRSLAFEFSRSGELSGVHVRQTVTRQEFLALRTTLEDLYGRPLDDGAILKMGTADTVEINFSLRPEVLAQFKEQLTSGRPDELARAAGTILKAGIAKDRFLLRQGDIKAIQREELSLGAAGQVSLLGKLRVSGQATLGHQQETRI